MWSRHVQVGDVIYLCENECELLGGISMGEYIVEDARDSGGWRVQIRKLDTMGNYCPDNPGVQFYQCHGYSRSLLLVKVTRRMKRIFI